MLVLTRKAGDTLLIGNDVEVVVLEVRGEQIKIGIRAPKDVRILRKEVLEAIEEANRAAAIAGNTDALARLVGGLAVPGKAEEK
ncbi:carbon storage regulator CsrA [Heliobacterium gestii]|uniref:Translational regulator CsrA n=1 Tax=Heliomicrobium gestii TaxID=2699 RepID=A0A845LBU9_HELGE|nr:carbon storage regulator CsrA [Heliomicrobium gestii]MBM7866669.1 carbon storage regulator [Heliomicrobium gestii]MZP43051.1 carbon storage regulator CsrA [Heliomicrobium gestii]